MGLGVDFDGLEEQLDRLARVPAGVEEPESGLPLDPGLLELRR
jgi:hypothetical protein